MLSIYSMIEIPKAFESAMVSWFFHFLIVDKGDIINLLGFS